MGLVETSKSVELRNAFAMPSQCLRNAPMPRLALPGYLPPSSSSPGRRIAWWCHTPPRQLQRHGCSSGWGSGSVPGEARNVTSDERRRPAKAWGGSIYSKNLMRQSISALVKCFKNMSEIHRNPLFMPGNTGLKEGFPLLRSWPAVSQSCRRRDRPLQRDVDKTTRHEIMKSIIWSKPQPWTSSR